MHQPGDRLRGSLLRLPGRELPDLHGRSRLDTDPAIGASLMPSPAPGQPLAQHSRAIPSSSVMLRTAALGVVSYRPTAY